MSDDELCDVLASVMGKPLQGAAMIPELGVLMLCFSEGKTLYVKGVLDYELEAAN